MNEKSLLNLTVKQLKRAAALKGKIDSLESQLARLLGGSDTSTNRVSVRRKRRMSRAGRARISKAAKARWAKIRAAKKSANN
jgi:hypothetical protein